MLNSAKRKGLKEKAHASIFYLSEILGIESFENGICEWGISLAGINNSRIQ